MRVLHIFLYIFFLIPALAELFNVFLTLSMIGRSFDSSNTIPFSVYQYMIPITIIFPIILNVIVLFYLIGSVFNIKNKFFNFFNKLFQTYKLPIMLSVLLTAGTDISRIVGISGIISYTTETARYMQYFFIFCKYGLPIIFLFLYRYIFMRGFLKSIGLVVMSFVTLWTLFIGLLIIFDFMPRHYFTFKLDDTKARYTINYDGDYWLTYYEVREKCVDEPAGRVCSEELTKLGNAAITESPVDLKPFIDKNVRITGDFHATRDKYGDKKQLCIKESFFKKTCNVSTGPGYWYASPIKIKTIELDK